MMKGKLTPVDFQLFIANNTVINTYGSSLRIVDLRLRRPYRWQFIIADVRQPIIGANFLAHHGILPDLKNRKLVDEQTMLSTKVRMTIGKQTIIATIDERCKVKELLRNYVEITRAQGDRTRRETPHRYQRTTISGETTQTAPRKVRRRETRVRDDVSTRNMPPLFITMGKPIASST